MQSNTAAFNVHKIVPLPGALLVVLAGGAAVGLLAAGVGSLLYLALVFPAAMGFAGGLIAIRAAGVANARRTAELLALAALTALVLYGSFHYGRYLVLQLQSAFLVSARVPDAGLSEKMLLGRILLDRVLQEETGQAGFVGYMRYKAQGGISLGRFYSENRLALRGALAWLYWALEFGLVLWITWTMARGETPVPVCEGCGRRFGPEKHLGGTSPANQAVLLELLGRGDLAGLGGLLQQEAGLPSLELYLQRCEACGGSGPSLLTVRRAEMGTRGMLALSDVSQARVAPGEEARFLSQLRYQVD
jgi:hypothetical protein